MIVGLRRSIVMGSALDLQCRACFHVGFRWLSKLVVECCNGPFFACEIALPEERTNLKLLAEISAS